MDYFSDSFLRTHLLLLHRKNRLSYCTITAKVVDTASTSLDLLTLRIPPIDYRCLGAGSLASGLLATCLCARLASNLSNSLQTQRSALIFHELDMALFDLFAIKRGLTRDIGFLKWPLCIICARLENPIFAAPLGT